MLEAFVFLFSHQYDTEREGVGRKKGSGKQERKQEFKCHLSHEGGSRDPATSLSLSSREPGFLGWGAQASILRSSSSGLGSTLAAKAPDHLAPP